MTPLFFLGSSPSLAASLSQKADGVMISVNQLLRRKSDFQASNWILDSGAFTRISRGIGHLEVGEYAKLIDRWTRCGHLLAAVSQDWMCEEFVLTKTGLTIDEHQELTIERYDALRQITQHLIIPVLQGYQPWQYLNHIDKYGERLYQGMWVGVGSICKRNSNPSEILNILACIKNKRPDLQLHGFGIKQTALESPSIRKLLHSCDSMAYNYSKKFGDKRSDEELAEIYMNKLTDSAQKQAPPRAGAGNGQGRKSSWNHSPTVPIRVPAKFATQLLAIAREWDSSPAAADSAQNQAAIASRFRTKSRNLTTPQ